jgi:alkaline phosphatase
LNRAGTSPRQSGDSYFQSAATSVQSRANDDFAPKAKNVILFVGDGMGVSTVTAARIYAGQQMDMDGESYRLTMESLPWSALSKTYSHDAQVADSASTATALMSGIKTLSRTLGLRSGISYGNCASIDGQGTDSLFEIAEGAGLATGIVSTARITHATPAATYAESADRNWEDDSEIGGTDCRDIARQLVEWDAGDGFEVVLGGGRFAFLPSTATDPETGEAAGKRTDGEDLTAIWTGRSAGHEYITDQPGFDAVDFTSDTRVLGLFGQSHMQFDLDRAEDTGGEPSLAELTEAAITRLSQDEDGFVLLVEGGRIDHAHHGVNAARALGDTAALDKAVKTALDMTDASETLIIVTADHSHTLTIAGYPARGNPILGKVAYGPGGVARADDGKPYTTLGYANGETGWVRKTARARISRMSTRPRRTSSSNPSSSQAQKPMPVRMYRSMPAAPAQSWSAALSSRMKFSTSWHWPAALSITRTDRRQPTACGSRRPHLHHDRGAACGRCRAVSPAQNFRSAA